MTGVGGEKPYAHKSATEPTPDRHGVEAGTFDARDDDDEAYWNPRLQRGLEDTIYFTGEEDGDADATRALRSPDNLDWADDGFIYVQEDKAEDDTLTGEPPFGAGAVNPNEAGIVRVDPQNAALLRVANIDRSVVLDASIAVQTDAVDVDAGEVGAWESSGILDVSTLFDEKPGTVFLFDIQAHGIEDQTNFNPSSRISDADLVEGGQLLFLTKPDTEGDDHTDDD